MKKTLLFIYLSAFVLLINLAACKKEASKNNDNDQIAAHSDDQEQFSSEVDGVANDADAAIESSSTFTGRLQGGQGIQDICDATVTVNAASDPRTITITYNGTVCLGGFHKRSGTVVLSMAANTQWKNAGASFTITFQNLKITRLSDNKSITINGSQTYTNVSGGLLPSLLTPGNTLTHSITSDGLSVTFDNGSQRNWKVSKQRVLANVGGSLVITTTGTHTDGNTTGIAEWGTNRFGVAFATAITEPLVVKQDCNFRLTSGKVKHTVGSLVATVTFGLNANGEATSCPGLAPFYLKIVLTGANGNSITLIRPY